MDELAGLPEGTLRRALQLDADERPAPFDAAAIAIAARHRTPLEQVLRLVRGLALVGVSLGIESAVAIAAFNVLATSDLSEPLGLALSAVAFVAQQVVAVGALTASTSVAVAALAAAVFATLYERSNGREPSNVRAS
ncbi:MAG: hypothetical protein M3Z65_08925 [Chloroflexota bacterium]|nr:hypothetical protein [Chloroflexota bacterium]